MLSFYSANVRSANTERAVLECMDIAFGDERPEGRGVLIFNAPLGHRLDRVAAAAKKALPNAIALGGSCSGVTGREGVGESMSDLAMMAIFGHENELRVSTVQEIYGGNAYEKGLELARGLTGGEGRVTAVYLLCPGIDIANDLVLKAFDEVLGADVQIFGGTSSDNMRGLLTQQYIGDALTEHSAWAVGFADSTLSGVTRATHGFTAYGNPLVVTRAEGNVIYEFNGKPAWQEYTERLGVTPKPETICGETIPIGALAEALPEAVAAEYGNSHILRVITKYDAETGAIYYATTVRTGLELWLTHRDEELIFKEQARSLEFIRAELGSHKPVAVFQTDCLARGRFLFNRIMKEELIGMMQTSLSNDGTIPPWIGMYGFGEYARLGDMNEYHNYSTALLVLCR